MLVVLKYLSYPSCIKQHVRFGIYKKILWSTENYLIRSQV